MYIIINKGQGKTDENEMVLGHMAIIPFPVLFAWHSVKKRIKTTKIKDNKIIKKSKKSNSFHSLIDFHLK